MIIFVVTSGVVFVIILFAIRIVILVIICDQVLLFIIEKISTLFSSHAHMSFGQISGFELKGWLMFSQVISLDSAASYK